MDLFMEIFIEEAMNLFYFWLPKCLMGQLGIVVYIAGQRHKKSEE